MLEERRSLQHCVGGQAPVEANQPCETAPVQSKGASLPSLGAALGLSLLPGSGGTLQLGSNRRKTITSLLFPLCLEQRV